MSRHLDVTLDKPVPNALSREVLAKIRYVSEGVTGAALVDDGRTIRIDFERDVAGNTERIAAAVQQVTTKIAGTPRLAAPPRVVARGSRSTAAVDTAFVDPHQALLDRQELFRYGNGRYGYGPLLVDLLERLGRLCSRHGRAIKARPQQFPSLIGADTLSACGYIRSFPHSLNLVLHLREDLETIQHFASTAALDGQCLHIDKDALASPETLLSPSVCFHCYRWLTGSRVEEGRSFLATGKCFRYESGNMSGLERLWDFTMHETIFVGTKDYVLRERGACIEFAQAVADELGLEYRIETATDPFFIEDYATQATFQSAFDLKFEIVAALPYRSGSLAVGSINYHQNFFGRAFQISDADGAPVHTVCLGFGLDRLALAVLAQHGTEPSRWPAALRDTQQ